MFIDALKRREILPTVIAVLCFPAAARSASPNPSDAAFADKTSRIERLLSEEAAKGLFNGAALVTFGDQVLVEKGYGFANLEHEIPITPETRFRLASASKSFTAVIIMRLIQQGRFTLETPLADLLPWYRRDVAERVTVHHLLSHSSGIPFEMFDELFCDQQHEEPLRKIVEDHHSADLEFEPGSKFKYSNSGYVILGAIIEEVTGKPFAEVIDELLFKPAGMTQSGSEQVEMIMPKRAQGYQGEAGHRYRQHYFNLANFARGAGTVYSTLEDLYRWDQALYSNALLTAENKRKMFTPYLTEYGYGWEVHKIQDDPPRTLVRHTGDAIACHALISRIIEDHCLVALLTNMDGTYLWDIEKGIRDILYSGS